jgi:chromosome partitioning protein
MLGDVDRQQSVRSWLQRRSPQAAKVNTWAVDNGKVFRAPPGTTHVILDTPGGLYDHELAKLVVWVDAVVVPIGPSVFDRDASLDFIKELQKLPKVASGRCKLAVIGMRWPMERVQQWHAQGQQWDIPLLTVIPDLAHYRSCLENGGSLFDMPEAIRQTDMPYWEPLLTWLDAVWKPAATNSNSPDLFNRLHTAAAQMRQRPATLASPPVGRAATRPISASVSARSMVIPTPPHSPSSAPGSPSTAMAWVPKWLRIA